MRGIGRVIGLALLALLALQLYFLARVALMRVVDPQSTSFQRSAAWHLADGSDPSAHWRQRWVPYERISANLKRAVIASEDSGFAEHNGVEWDALEKAWERNQKAEARVAEINARLDRRTATRAATGPKAAAPPVHAAPRIVGGSTITQQLAKNLFLDGERSLARKGQEFVITFMLEALLDKRRILEIYLNSVEWGAGVYGAEAAAERYFQTSAAALTPQQAAQLAVMLPAPRRFEQRPRSAYVIGRAGTVAARMGAVELP